MASRRAGEESPALLAQGVIVKAALFVLNVPYDAVTCAGVAAVTRPVVTRKVMEVAPAGMVTCAGTLTTKLRRLPGEMVRGAGLAPVSLLVSATVKPPAGAGPVS